MELAQMGYSSGVRGEKGMGLANGLKRNKRRGSK